MAPSPSSMTASLCVSLPEHIELSMTAERELLLRSEGEELAFSRLPAVTEAAVRALAAGATEEAALADSVFARGGTMALARLYHCFELLARRGWLLRSVRLADRRLATLVPLHPEFRAASSELPSATRSILSRFAHLHRAESELVLESPLSRARVVLHDWRAAAVVAALAVPRSRETLEQELPMLEAGAAALLLTLLRQAGMVADADEGEERAHGPALRSWELHDLLFHVRSRPGRHRRPLGATLRFAGELPPPPAVKRMEGEALELFKPDLERLMREDPPFALVQETRHSIRRESPEPLTARALGELLYRVGRIRQKASSAVPTPRGALSLDLALRPYPAGGALYELELYPLIHRCEDLAEGLYHYDAEGHRLVRLTPPTDETRALLREAAAHTCYSGTPQVLLIIAARFQRIAWRYEGLAYSLVLKHVGVLQQTLYLAATAMGLAPCAVGAGNSDLFARAAGLDYYAETSVGEFLLGALAEPSPPPAGRVTIATGNLQEAR